MNSFNLTLSGKYFICPSILNDSFAGESNLGYRTLWIVGKVTGSLPRAKQVGLFPPRSLPHLQPHNTATWVALSWRIAKAPPLVFHDFKYFFPAFLQPFQPYFQPFLPARFLLRNQLIVLWELLCR